MSLLKKYLETVQEKKVITESTNGQLYYNIGRLINDTLYENLNETGALENISAEEREQILLNEFNNLLIFLEKEKLEFL